jgi:hypothetical protein
MKRRPHMKGNATTRNTRRVVAPDMRSEYDFSNAVRGKYHKRYLAGSNVVVLDPDGAATFKNAAAVNDALRGLLRVAHESVGLAARSTRTPRKRSAA